MVEGELTVSTPEEQAQSTGRHPSIVGLLRWFSYEHLTDPAARQISAEFARLAQKLVMTIRHDDPELAIALRKLLEGKDAAVRAQIAATQAAPPGSSWPG